MRALRSSLVVAAAIAALTCAGCGSDGSANELSGSIDGVGAAVLDVESGADSITVRSADLGDDLYRVSTPDDAGVDPAVERDEGRVQVFLHDNGEGGPAAVLVELADSVRWRLQFNGGASHLVVDHASGKLRGVDIAAGIARIELTLPRPAGTVPVELSGGASVVALHLPAGVPARVTIQSGAGSVTIDGESHSGVAAGTDFTPPSWEAARNRYDVVTHAGVATLTLDRMR